MSDNAIEITDFSSQTIKMYLQKDVVSDLNYKIEKNFSSNNPEQRERAEVLFRHLNRGLFNIANGLFDNSNITPNGELFYDLFEDIGTVLFVPIINDQKEIGVLVTRIVWKYYSNDWWSIVETRNNQFNSRLKHMIDESVRRVFAERRNRRLNEAVGRSFRMVLREYLTRNR